MNIKVIVVTAVMAVLSVGVMTATLGGPQVFPSVTTQTTLQNNFDQTAFIMVSAPEKQDKTTIASEDVAQPKVIPMGSGSGVFLRDRLVLTACHVVLRGECKDWNASPYDKIKVTLMGQIYTARVAKWDKPKDLALLVLDDPFTSAQPVTLSCDRLTYDRHPLFAIGYPYRVGKLVKSGYLSQPQASFNGDLGYPEVQKPWDGDYTMTDEQEKEAGNTEEILTANAYGTEQGWRRFFNQLDMQALPGNSGGPVFTDTGKLTGIVSNILKYPGEGQVRIRMPMAPGVAMTVKGEAMTFLDMGLTHVTKPERICEFVNSITDKVYNPQYYNGTDLGSNWREQ